MTSDRAHANPDARALDDELVAVPRAAFDELVARVARLEAGAGSAASAPSTGPSSGAMSAPTTGNGADHVPDGDRTTEATDRKVGRRRALLGLAGAAGAATAGAVLGSATPAAATNGSAVVLGSAANSASQATGIEVDATHVAYGLGITDNGLGSFSGSAAVLAHATNNAFTTGLYVLATGAAEGMVINADQIGMSVYSNTSSAATFHTDSQNGYTASATAPVQGGGSVALFGSADTQLELVPHTSEPPAVAYAGRAGQVRAIGDPGGTTLWACTAQGIPGTWQQLAGPTTAGAFHLLPTPKRVYDSRPGTSPNVGSKTPLVGGAAGRAVDLTVNSSGVPKGATGALITLLLVNASSGSGNVTLWANGAAHPSSNTMVWGGSAGRFTTLAVTALDANGKAQIAASLKTDVVLDVVGYYR